MSEQDSDKKKTSAASGQATGSAKSGGSGSTGAAKGGSGSTGGSGSEESRKGAAASGGSKGRSGSGNVQRSGGKQEEETASYLSVSRVPAPDVYQAHGPLVFTDAFQVAPRIWPD